MYLSKVLKLREEWKGPHPLTSASTILESGEPARSLAQSFVVAFHGVPYYSCCAKVHLPESNSIVLVKGKPCHAIPLLRHLQLLFIAQCGTQRSCCSLKALSELAHCLPLSSCMFLCSFLVTKGKVTI